MGIIAEGAKAAGKFIAPGAAKVIERYGPKPDEGSRLGLLGKDILRAAFPGVYAVTDKLKLTGGQRKPKPRDKQSAVTESVSELSNEVVETNAILSTSIEIQTQQNIILTEILKAIKEGGSAGGGTGNDPNLRLGPKSGKGGRTGASGKGGRTGASGKTKPQKGKPSLKSRITTGTGNALKAGGRIISGAPVLGGLFSAGIEYSESGKAGRAAAAGGGATAGAIVGGGIGALTGPLAPFAIPVASFIGGIAGDQLGKLAYDMFSGDKEDKKEQKFDTQYITYNAEDINFKSNSMSIKARTFTIAGDVGGLNLGVGSSEPGMLPGVAKGDAADRQNAINDIGGKFRGSRPGTGSLEGFTIRPGIDPRVNKGIVDKLKGLQSSIPGMVVTSGYRDPARNAAAGGASGSQHLQGNAVDINFPANIEQTVKVIEAASAAGIGGIGVYGPGKLHLDTGSKRAWGPSYSVNSVPEWALEAIKKHTGMKGYAGGTNNVPQTGPAIVGEKGPELVVGKNGVSMTPDQATVVNLNQGDKVIPAGVRPLTPIGGDTGPISIPKFKFGKEALIDQALQNPTLKGGLEYVGEKNIIAKQGAIKEANGTTLAGAYYPKGFMGSKEGRIVYDESRGHAESQLTLNHELRHAASGRMYMERLQNRDAGFVQSLLDKGYIDPKTGKPTPENPYQGVGEEARNRLTDLSVNTSRPAREIDYDRKFMDQYMNQGLTDLDSESERKSVRERRREQLYDANQELDNYYSTKMLGAMFGNAN